MAIVGNHSWASTEEDYRHLLNKHFYYCSHTSPSQPCYEAQTRRKILTLIRARFNLLALSNSFLVTAEKSSTIRYEVICDSSQAIMSYGETRTYPDIIHDRIFTFYSVESRKRVFIDLTKIHSRIEFEHAYVYYNAYYILIEVYNPNNPDEIISAQLRSTFDDLSTICTFPPRPYTRGESSALVYQKLYVGVQNNVFSYDSTGFIKLNKEPLPLRLTLEHPFALFSSTNREDTLKMLDALHGNLLKDPIVTYVFILEGGKLVVYNISSRDFFETQMDSTVKAYLRDHHLFVFGKNEIVKFNLLDLTTLSREKINTTITRFESANDMFALLQTKDGKQLWNLSENKFEIF